jgi:hypothetical protein
MFEIFALAMFLSLIFLEIVRQSFPHKRVSAVNNAARMNAEKR